MKFQKHKHFILACKSTTTLWFFFYALAIVWSIITLLLSTTTTRILTTKENCNDSDNNNDLLRSRFILTPPTTTNNNNNCGEKNNDRLLESFYYNSNFNKQQQQGKRNHHNKQQQQQQHAYDGDGDVVDNNNNNYEEDNNNNNKNKLWIDSYVISLDESKVQNFFRRNHHNDGIGGLFTPNNTIFFKGYDGYDQSTLNEYHKKLFPKTQLLNVTQFIKGNKRGYNNPHVVGCYMSHYNLLRTAMLKYYYYWNWNNNTTTSNTSNTSSTTTNTSSTTTQQNEKRIIPDGLFILEDDTYCSNTTLDVIRNVIPKLPQNWDMLYVGGKPFVKYNRNISDIIQQYKTIERTTNRNNRTYFRDILLCQGKLGSSYTGPFNPNPIIDDDDDDDDGKSLSSRRRRRRDFHLNQSYWQTKFIINTHSYIVNPKRIQNIVQIIENQHDSNSNQIIVPIDVKYANNMLENKLNVYMTPYKYCVQPNEKIVKNNNDKDNKGSKGRRRKLPRPFDGFYYHPQLTDLKGYYSEKKVWDYLYHPNCPGY